MVAMPDYALDPTLEAVHRAVESLATKEKLRNYLGASQAGGKCDRKNHYDLVRAPKSPKKAKLIYAAEDGYRCEEVIAQRLRMVEGIELWTHDENGKQFEFTDLDGKFRGHPDGIIKGLIQSPKTLHIWENKSKNQKLFDEFKKAKDQYGEKACLENWHFEYYVQAQILMHYFEMTRHYMTVCLAGARDIASCRTDYHKSFALAQIDKAKRLLAGAESGSVPTRISERREFWLCKFCDYHEHCWKDA